MALHRVSDTEVTSDDGYRVRFDHASLVFAQGTRYITIPLEVDAASGDLRVSMSLMSSWMENGKPCNAEGTLNVNVLRSRIAGALKFLDRKAVFA